MPTQSVYTATTQRTRTSMMATTASKRDVPKVAAKITPGPGDVMTLSRYMLEQARINVDFQVRSSGGTASKSVVLLSEKTASRFT